MSHDQKIEFIGGIWDGQMISFGGDPPMTFLVPRMNPPKVFLHNVGVAEKLGSDEVVSVYVITENCYVFSHYQYAELFRNKKDVKGN